MIFEISNALLNLIFPKSCFLCKTIIEKGWLCSTCDLKQPILHPFTDGYYLFEYTGLPRKMMHHCKFCKEADIAVYFSKFLKDLAIWESADIIIPVPLFFLRQWQRGFNQNYIMLKHARITYQTMIKRQRYTRKLYRLSRDQRINELKDAFSIEKNINATELLKNKRIVIFDDIYTSGTTFREMKTVLDYYQPKSVKGLFLMKA